MIEKIKSLFTTKDELIEDSINTINYFDEMIDMCSAYRGEDFNLEPAIRKLFEIKNPLEVELHIYKQRSTESNRDLLIKVLKKTSREGAYQLMEIREELQKKFDDINDKGKSELNHE